MKKDIAEEPERTGGEAEREAPPQAQSPPETEYGPECDRGLLAIGVFKLTKALFFFCVGLGVVHYLHRDLGNAASRLVAALKFDPESRLVNLLITKAYSVSQHRLMQIGYATFAYSGVALTEGIGLMLEQVWAEYLTLSLTVAFLPWEIYEFARRPNLSRAALLLANSLVLIYLVWVVRTRHRERRQTARARGPRTN